MSLKWTDTLDIAIELSEIHTDIDPQYIRFTDLHAWVCALEEFDARRMNTSVKTALAGKQINEVKL